MNSNKIEKRRGRIDNRNQGWINNNNNNNWRGSAQNNAYYDGAKIVNHRFAYGHRGVEMLCNDDKSMANMLLQRQETI